MEWIEHYIRIKAANPFRVTQADIRAFYVAIKRELWPTEFELQEEPIEQCDPLVYIVWFAHGVPAIARHVNEIFRHVAHEFTLSEHMAIMRAAVSDELYVFDPDIAPIEFGSCLHHHA